MTHGSHMHAESTPTHGRHATSTYGTSHNQFGPVMVASMAKFKDLDETIIKFKDLNIKIQDLGTQMRPPYHKFGD